MNPTSLALGALASAEYPGIAVESASARPVVVIAAFDGPHLSSFIHFCLGYPDQAVKPRCAA